MKILVTGGNGFIGSNYLNLFVPEYSNWNFINLDYGTYSNNDSNVLSKTKAMENYRAINCDISNPSWIYSILQYEDPDLIVHFAAETHVDNATERPRDFVNTNIIGTLNILEFMRKHNKPGRILHLVSTDEVYGSLGEEGFFNEESNYSPNNVYSATKASADHLVNAYHKVYGLNTKITHCCNNFGPNQHYEKLIPKVIASAIRGEYINIYGDGSNIRDWIFVLDHCNGIMSVDLGGVSGCVYDIGAGWEFTNLDIVHKICELISDETGIAVEELNKQIRFVKDRPAHDFRYAIDSSKIKEDIGWAINYEFEEALRITVHHYVKLLSFLKSERKSNLEYLKIA